MQGEHGMPIATGAPEVKSPRVSALLNKRLNELNLTRSDFIRKLQREYGANAGTKNHLFKILNGQSIVGERGLLPLITKSLGLDLDEVTKLVRTDKIDSKDWASALPKANKIVQEVATVMETLSKRDQEEILMFVKMKASRH
jgi:hypothetical protein